MPVIIKGSSNTTTKAILYVVLIVVIAIVAYLLWTFVISAYIKGTLFPATKVECTTAPSTPTSISATISANRAFVQWSATTNTDTYTLYVGKSSAFSTALAERVITVKGNSIAVLNLIPNTYYFKVASVNSCGTSSLSVEISATVTQWPSKFKLCKKEDPTVCMSMLGAGSDIKMSVECAGNQCELEYQDLQNIKSFGANLCMQDHPDGFPTIEANVTSETCSPTSSDWTIDLGTGRIYTVGGLCFGAASVPGTTAYNTTCASISNPDDARYAWVMQATNN